MNTDHVISFTKNEGAKGESSRFFDEKVRNGFYAKFIRKGTVVDIGYKGSGNQPLFTESIGLDTDTPNYNGRDFPWPDESIGTVICSHVLEHVADYGHFLREIFRVLKPGGTAILSVPLKDVYERKDFPPSRFNGDHKRFYTVQRLFYEIETSVPRNLYKIVFLEEHFLDKNDFYHKANLHARKTGYEIECVLEKLNQNIPTDNNREITMKKEIAENIVKALYNFFLFREPDPSGLECYTKNIQNYQNYEHFMRMLTTFITSKEFYLKRNIFIEKRIHLQQNNESTNINIEDLLPYIEYNTKEQKNILVTGFERSGTSAMVSLLNFSNQIFITHEFFPCEKKSWLHSCFTEENHINSFFRYINEKYSIEDRGDELLRRVFPEIEVSQKQMWKNILQGGFLYRYCTSKIQNTLTNYRKYKIVGDKHPNILDINIINKLILNNNLNIIAMIREPYDIYMSFLERIEREKLTPFNMDLFEYQLEHSFKTIATLQKYCPERIICVKYEGFYESEERIHNLFARLTIDPASLHEEGIRYICERARLLSQRRPSLHKEILQRNHLEYDPSRFDHLKHIIDWTTVI